MEFEYTQKEYLPVEGLDFKAAEDGSGTFTGYASTFRNEDLVRDVVDVGAFTKTLQQSKGVVPVLMAHMGSQMVGVGVDAHEDAKGLFVTAALTLDNTHGANAYANIKAATKYGLKLGLSIGYGIPEGGATWDEKRGVRHLKQIDLYEYSIAPVPANPKARITGVKGREFTEREIEALLHDAGLSKSQARAVLAGGFGAALGRDAHAAGKETHALFGRDAQTGVRRDAVTLPPIARNGGLLVAELRAALLGR